MTSANDGDGVSGHDVPLPYMKRIHEYYAAIGYAPYRWSHHVSAPFAPLSKPLSRTKVALVTTAAPWKPELGDQGPGAAYNSAAKFYTVYSGDSATDHDLRISHIGYDRKHTSAKDSGTWFPLPALRKLVEAGRIGSLTDRFHGLPTNRSQRHSMEVDCPELLARCRADGAEAAILVAV